VEEENGMKRFLWTWIALLAVGLLFLLTMYDGRRMEGKKAAEEKDKTLIKVAMDAIVKIEIVKRGENVVLEREAQGADRIWNLIRPFRDRADDEAISQLLGQLSAEKAIQTIVEGSDLQLEAFGLSTPLGYIRISTNDGKTHEVRIGTVHAYDSNLYAQVDQEPRVLLVTGSWDIILSRGTKDLRNKNVFPNRELKFTELKRIKVSRPAEGAVGGFEIKKDGESWKIVGGRNFPVANDKLEAVFEQIKTLRALQFIDRESGEDLAKAQRALRQAELSIELFTESKEPVFSVKLNPEVGSKFGVYYAAVAGRSEVVTISSGSVTSLDKTVQDFYDRQLPFRFKPEEVGKVEISTPELTGEFTKKDTKWSVSNPELQKRLDTAKIDSILERLSRMEALRILAPLSQSGQMKSRLILKNKNDEKIFEFAWGSELQTEKMAGRKPEARFLSAFTSLSDHYLGIAESEILNLGIATLVVSAPVSAPVPTPVPTPISRSSSRP
jgi:hypothetical protein